MAEYEDRSRFGIVVGRMGSDARGSDRTVSGCGDGACLATARRIGITAIRQRSGKG